MPHIEFRALSCLNFLTIIWLTEGFFISVTVKKKLDIIKKHHHNTTRLIQVQYLLVLVVFVDNIFLIYKFHLIFLMLYVRNKLTWYVPHSNKILQFETKGHSS